MEPFSAAWRRRLDPEAGRAYRALSEDLRVLCLREHDADPNRQRDRQHPYHRVYAVRGPPRLQQRGTMPTPTARAAPGREVACWPAQTRESWQGDVVEPFRGRIHTVLPFSAPASPTTRSVLPLTQTACLLVCAEPPRPASQLSLSVLRRSETRT